MTATMLEGFWESTFAPDPVSGKPFAVDAIISNPPAFGHVHIAEALGVPLMLSFSAHSFSLEELWPRAYIHSNAMDPVNILQTSSGQHQRDQRRKEYDQLPILRHGKSTPVAGFGRYHQRVQKCHTRSRALDTEIGTIRCGSIEDPLHLLLE